MQKHTRAYLDAMGYGNCNFSEDIYIKCEIPSCNSKVVDVHHIHGRRGADRDEAHNLIGLCRFHHEQAHRNKIAKSDLDKIVGERKFRLTIRSES